MRAQLALPAAVVIALAGRAVDAQVARPAPGGGGIAVRSGDPSGRTTFGQSGPIRPILPGGGGAGAAAMGARPGAVVLPPRPVMPGPAVRSGDPSGRTTFGQSGPIRPILPGGGGAGAAQQAPAGYYRPSANGASGPVFGGVGSFGGGTAFGATSNPAALGALAPGVVVPGANTGFGPGGGTTFGPNVPGPFGTGFVDPTGFGAPGFANGFNNGFGFGNGFNDGFGFGNGFFNGFNQGFGFYPGFAAAPYLGGFYGATYPVTNGIAPPFNPASMVPNPMPPYRVPVLGVNVPVRPVNSARFANARTTVRTAPKTPEDLDRMRRIEVQETAAGTREELRDEADRTDRTIGTRLETEAETGTIAIRPEPEAEVQFAPATRDQVKLAAKVERLMAERPMRQGLVTRIGRNTVDVNYEYNGESRTDPFPAGEVFFFQPSGSLATAATAGDRLHIGDRVLVACDDRKSSQPRQAVAGSRQEVRTSVKSSPRKNTRKAPARRK